MGFTMSDKREIKLLQEKIEKLEAEAGERETRVQILWEQVRQADAKALEWRRRADVLAGAVFRYAKSHLPGQPMDNAAQVLLITGYVPDPLEVKIEEVEEP